MSHTLSLTEVRALDDPEPTVAAEGADGSVGGDDVYARAKFFIPHHCHQPAAVQAIHGEIPEALLLEGQGRGWGEQSDHA